MNYRHIYHAGNFSDVFKHFILVEILLKLREKEAPFCVIDTHAGLGIYDLQTLEAQKTQEYKKGVDSFFQKAVDDVHFHAYLEVIRSLNKNDQELKYYPGSPYVSRFYLRPHDRLILSEFHPQDASRLGNFFIKDKQTKVLMQDGYRTLKSCLPPPQRRGLILIDPPYEQLNEFQIIFEGLKEAYKRFSHGIYMIWYPIKEMKPIHDFYKNLKDLSFKMSLRLELFIYPDLQPDRLNGCGLMILNPPWLLADSMRKILPKLQAFLSSQGKFLIVENP